MDFEMLRGDIFFADLDPVVGSEQGGTRPVLVVQNNTGNRHSGTTIVAAITNRKKPSLPTHVQVPFVVGLDEHSIILLEQLRTIDKTRLVQKVNTLSARQMQLVDIALMVSLGIKNTLTNSMVMTLCRSCAQTFRDSNDYLVRRADFEQEVCESCTMCNVRTGYDFEIVRL